MATTPEERLATIEQQLRDVVQDIADLREQHRQDHHRLRTVEGAAAMMVEAQQAARRGEAVQYRRLEIRIQWLVLAVSVVGLALTLTLTLLHR